MHKIPFYAKHDPRDHSCAPVCLRMALAHFGVIKGANEIYKLVDAIGDTHYTLPWGICIGAAQCGLCTTFVSKQPRVLLDSSYEAVASLTGTAFGDIRSRVDSLIARCTSNKEHITLVDWDEGHESWAQELVTSGAAVVIPTLRWEPRQPHNVVLTAWHDDAVQYHDPNLLNGSDLRMPAVEFQKLRNDPITDNDLLVVSRASMT